MENWKQVLVDFWEDVEKNNAKEDAHLPKPANWRKEAHIPYAGDYEPTHLLNLYYPEEYDPARGKLKTVIYIHGGGWMYGNIDVSENYLGWIASRGYAVMAMNYTLLQDTDLGGIVKDIFEALKWLSVFGGERGFDLENVLITGDSAGGHLTGLVSAIMKDPELAKIYGVSAVDLGVKAICLNCPCSETDVLYINGEKGSEKGEGTAAAYLELMLGERKEAAPWYGHTSLSSVMKGIKLPPMLLIGSRADSLHDQTKLLIKAMDETAQEYETLIWEERPHLQHVFNISHWEWRESLISNEKMLKFFEDHT